MLTKDVEVFADDEEESLVYEDKCRSFYKNDDYFYAVTTQNIRLIEDDEWKNKEKFYWRTKKGNYIEVDKIEERHLKNIVYKFGKDTLEQAGYKRIVAKFNELLKGEKDGI